MKKTIRVFEKESYKDKEINYIPLRYILSCMLAILEIAMIIAIVFLLTIYIDYFYILLYVTVICIVVKIIGSNENPDYKVPWIVMVIAIPIVGMMLYFLFSKRVLPKKIIRRLEHLNKEVDTKDHSDILYELKNVNENMYSQALCLSKISNTHIYKNNEIRYFESGEKLSTSIFESLKQAKKFIFLEYFIIEEGYFWNTILDILKEKASNGVLVKVVYDDIGCMSTLPGDYYKELKKYNIEAVTFSILKGNADGEFNNRSHRKILVIDGEIAFTGGLNIADEYINLVSKFGYWKDTAIKITGNSVNELTRLFLIDFYLNVKTKNELSFDEFYVFKKYDYSVNNYIVPFGDGPRPIYDKNVGKIAIMNLINHATKYVYITTPYLIIDNEMMRCIENASLRGVDVRIIIPGIPDKKLVYEITKDSAEILIKSNVHIYEYTDGFIHAKSYIADDVVGIIGTINLDYRSLTHHFENGVWMYDTKTIKTMKEDFIASCDKSNLLNDVKKKTSIIKKFIRAIIKIFSPLL